MTSNWSLIGYIAGLFLIVCSAIRYFIIWIDYSQALEFISIGILICCCAWLYNQNLNKSNRLTAIEDYLSELNNRRDKNGK